MPNPEPAPAASWRCRRWCAPAWADFDLDGHPDLFVPSGLGWPWAFVPDTFYRSRGDGRFSEEAEALVPGTSGHLASPDRRLFFGLPAGTVRASVRVTWPGGGPQTEELVWEPGDLVVREVVEAP